jgi:hypothetical protein
MKPEEHSSEARYILHVEFENRQQPWHATLERADILEGYDFERLEFESPLILARHLMNLGLPQTSKRGLQ